ncbi:DUF3224 domain-containing protein [Pseudoduganella plicata]|nr:DUF3224 domain-containing protein [Pseudoduganella plicata]
MTAIAASAPAIAGTEIAGTFDIALRLVPEVRAAGDTRARMTFTKTFQGPLAGTSDGEMLTAGKPEQGAAGYVAVERFDGTLAGRRGSFVLQHSGTMLHGRDSLLVLVSPGSGTGELAGIAGTMRIDTRGGGHRYTFDYDLPPMTR